MKKVVICLIMVLVFLCGCANNTSNTTESSRNIEKEIGSKMSNDEIVIASENLNYNFYRNVSVNSSVGIDLITKSPIDKDKMEISFDSAIPLSYDIQKMNDKYDFFEYATYNKFDWKENDGTGKKLEQLKNQYNSLDKNEVGKIFRYRITFDFTAAISDGHYEKIREICIKYKGKMVKKKIGTIAFAEFPWKMREGNGLIVKDLAGTEIPVYPNDKGEINFSGGEFVAKKDITIKNIFVLDKASLIKKCSLNFEKGGKSENQSWKSGDKIHVAKGTSIQLNLQIISKKNIGKMFYGSNQAVVMKYVCNGKEYDACYDAEFEKKSDVYELYGLLKEGLNFYDYYQYYA